MSSPAIYSQTRVYIKSGSVEIEIPGVTNIGGPNLTKAEVDISNMSSTSKEFMAAALSDPGTLTLDMQYAPANDVHKYITSQSANQGTAADLFKIKFSEGTNWRFTGSILTLNITAADPAAGVLTAQTSVRLSGAINFSSGSVA